MPSLRLKTKLVIAISGMVLAIVATLSTLYLSKVVRLRMLQTLDDGQFIAHQIFSEARDPLEIALSDTNVDFSDPKQVETVIRDVLRKDSGITSLLGSIVGYSPTIQDAAVTNNEGRALVHTSPSFLGGIVNRREDFASIVSGGIWKQLKIIYGPAQVYDVHEPLEINGNPFGEIRVGVSTVLLKNQIQPVLNQALIFAGGSIVICLVLAALLSNFALRPLAAINRRLDLINSGQVEVAEAPARPADEYGAVASKIDRLGRQMRDAKEIFSALKENLDQMMANLQDGVMLFTSDF
ncbi:MAG TPA: hypothetical protein VI636_18710, partial [Candidatus Angelobacter sp.]